MSFDGSGSDSDMIKLQATEELLAPNTHYYRIYMKSFGGVQCKIIESESGCVHDLKDQAGGDKSDNPSLYEMIQAQIKAQIDNQANGTRYLKFQSNPFKAAFDMNCKQCIYSHLGHKKLSSGYLSWLFRNFHCYPSITKYYWHYSKTWKRDFADDSETKDFSYLDKQVIGDMLYHINFYRLRHWKFFIFNGWLQELAFIIGELYLHVFGLNAVNIDKISQLDVVPVLMLFNCLMNGFVALKQNEKFMIKHQNKMKMIERNVHDKIHNIVVGYRKLKSPNPMNPSGCKIQFIENLMNEHFEIEAKIVTRTQSNKWSKQFSNQECASSKCQIKRGSKGKSRREFVKCKRCKIAVYCSRGCAKYDWNKGNHKSYCERYQIVS